MSPEKSLRDCILIPCCFVAILWGLELFEQTLGASLHQFSVLPRTQAGLVGIVTGPLLHLSWQHLVSNTAPLLLLGSMLLYGYPRSRWWALAGIWLLSGLGVWLFARSSYHLGASGITHGIFFFLFVSGMLRRDRRSAALLMVAFYLYGSMVLTILPLDSSVSFESHLFGALAGSFLAYLFRDLDPRSQRRRYSWERSDYSDSSPEEDDPIIGDQWRNEED